MPFRSPHFLWILCIVGLFAILIQTLCPSDSPDNMDENFDELRKEFKSKNMSAFVLGYTGETGKALVKELLTSGVFARVVLIGRREVKYEDELYKDVEQKIIDFDKLDEHKSAFDGFDQGFSCLGTTRKKSGADGFYKVDHDYVVNTAQIARDAGCSHLHLVSSQGASKSSWFLYPKTKGEVEEELKAMNFPKLSIYRPALLMCDREESRAAEAVFQVLAKPMARYFPGVITSPTSVLAQAMVNLAVSKAERDKPSLVVENKAIHQIAGAFKSKN